MSVEITYNCNGCDATASSGRVKAEHVPIFGGNSGWCKREVPTIEQSAPEGWVAFDPYTLCCYCPKCCAEIWPADDDVAATTGGGS